MQVVCREGGQIIYIIGSPPVAIDREDIDDYKGMQYHQAYEHGAVRQALGDHGVVEHGTRLVQ
jgi:hypothetical protein